MFRTSAILATLVLVSSTLAVDEPTAEEKMPKLQGVEVNSLEREVIVDRYANGRPKVEREVAMDHEENFVNHGNMRIYNQQGAFVGGGEYEWGRRVGKWTRIYNAASEAPVLNQVALRGFKAPFVSEATFEDDELDGIWFITDAAGKLLIQWEFANGKRDGHWTWFAANGDVRQQINYRDGQIVGDIVAFQGKETPRVLERYLDGRRLVADVERYPNGRQKKQGTLLMPSQVTKVQVDWWAGSVEESTLRTDGEPVRHGEYKYWYPSGRPQMVGTYRSGKETGGFAWYYDNGEKQTEGAFIGGRRDGEWREWFGNGQLKGVGQYAGGLRSGKWRTWFDNGMRQRDGEFRSGQQVGTLRVWNRSGLRVYEELKQDIAEKKDAEPQLTR